LCETGCSLTIVIGSGRLVFLGEWNMGKQWTCTEVW